MTNRRIWERPLTCEDCRKLLPSFIKEELGAELTGRVRGHLNKCDACEEAFAEALESALVSGELPLVEVPATVPAFPARELFDALQATQFKGALWDWVKRQQDKQAQDLMRMLFSAITLWRADHMSRRQRFRGVRGLGKAGELQETLGETEELQEASVQHVDASWQPLKKDEKVQIVQPPVITADGKFILTLSATEAKWSGRTLICKMELVEGGLITFETTFQPTPDGKKWQAKIEADGLPTSDEDVPVPIELLHLYLAPVEEKL